MNIFFTIDSLTSKMAILHTDSNFLFLKILHLYRRLELGELMPMFLFEW